MSGATHIWRGAVYELLEGHKEGGEVSRLIQGVIITLIMLNGVAVIMESNQTLYLHFYEWFQAFELLSVTIFSVEYVSRVWVSAEKKKWDHLPDWRTRLAFMASPMAIVDLLAVIPFYLSLLIPIDLRYLRFFRLLRLLKLSHYFDGLQVFATVLRREVAAIAGALLAMMTLIIISACLMFTVENAASPGHFESITEAIWWAVVTLTTVGYGDITPITFGGKLLGMLIMMLGVCTMALPAGILAARFTEEIQSRKEIINDRISEALHDGVLDTEEENTIKTLQEELCISREIVERTINRQRQQVTRNRYCAHCGERVDT